MARRARRVRHLQEAGDHLKRALDAFRRSPEAHSRASKPLARLVAAEVRRLERLATRDEGDSRRPVGSESMPSLGESDALLSCMQAVRALYSATEPLDVARIALAQAVGQLPSDRGLIALVGDEALSYPYRQGCEPEELIPAYTAREADRLIKRAAASERVALTVRDEQTEEGERVLPGVRAAASLGRLDDQTPVVLYLEHDDLPPDGAAKWRRGIETFVMQARAAFSNALSHQRKDRRIQVTDEELRRAHSSVDRRVRYRGLIGSSPAMQEVYKRLDLIAPTSSSVLLQGETGTGKELVARLIHDLSPRQDGPFVIVDCAALPDTLLESELFGFEAGAFTGAQQPRAGLLEVADRGTLFLDEVGEMSSQMQRSLLRVLQSGETRRLGAVTPKTINVRVIAATHRDLEAMIADGGFREDLYFRLGVLRLGLPVLRERGADVVLLLSELLSRHRQDAALPTISPPAVKVLMAHSWPGNVRELDNLAQRLAALGVDPVEPSHLEDIRFQACVPTRHGTLRELELEVIRDRLDKFGGNKTEAAKALGITRKTLLRKLKGAGDA